MWQSSAQASIICLFELVHLNDLLFDEWVDHVIIEVNVKEALKSSIFVVQKAATPKKGVEQDLVFSVKLQFGNLCLENILGPKHFLFQKCSDQKLVLLPKKIWALNF